jgi:hypothetical protein
MKQLIDILNLNITTTFNLLDIERTIEVLSSPSKSNSFSHQDNSKIASKELKIFDPELSEKYNINNLIYSNKNTIYRSVHLFIERI